MLNPIIFEKLSITDMLNPVISEHTVESLINVNSMAVDYDLSAINMYNNDFGLEDTAIDGIEAAGSIEVMVKQKGQKQSDTALSADKALPSAKHCAVSSSASSAPSSI